MQFECSLFKICFDVPLPTYGDIIFWQYTLAETSSEIRSSFLHLKVPKCLTNIFYGKETWVGSWISWQSPLFLPTSLCCLEDRYMRMKIRHPILWRLNDHCNIGQKYKESEFLKASGSTISALDCPSLSLPLNRNKILLNLCKLLFGVPVALQFRFLIDLECGTTYCKLGI